MSIPNLNEFYRQFLPKGEQVDSVPLKPPSFHASPLKSHSQAREPKPRSIAALAAAAAAGHVPLEAGAVIPRRFDQPPGVVENGAASDIIRAGMATINTDGGPEAFVLTVKGVRAIQSSVSPHILTQYFAA